MASEFNPIGVDGVGKLGDSKDNKTATLSAIEERPKIIQRVESSIVGMSEKSKTVSSTTLSSLTKELKELEKKKENIWIHNLLQAAKTCVGHYWTNYPLWMANGEQFREFRSTKAK